MVAGPARGPRETIALLKEMDGKMKLVEDVTREGVSEMHARSILVGILDPVSRHHTAINHSKSYEALKKIALDFANNSTTGQEAMRIGRVEASATMQTTPWVHNSGGPAKNLVTCPGKVPTGLARAKARTRQG